MPRYAVVQADPYYSALRWQILRTDTYTAVACRRTRREARALVSQLRAAEAAPTTTVYRVGHRTERHRLGFPYGPYCGRQLLSLDLPDDTTPPPTQDGIPRVNRDEIFGFASLAAFAAWFGPALNTLHDAGYVLHAFRVPPTSVRYGYRQVVFPHHAAELIETHSLRKLASPASI